MSEGEEAPLEERVVRLPDGAIALRMGSRERSIVGALVGDLRLLLEHDVRVPGLTSDDEEAGDARPDESLPAPSAPVDPVDPVVGRLYPDARPDDPGASERFRDLVHGDLADGRRARITVVEETLDATSLDDGQAEAWLGVLNDLRLVMGTRLGVTDETEAQPVPDEAPDAAERMVYAYAGWLESQFVDVLAAALPPVPDDPIAGGAEDDRSDPEPEPS